MVVGSNKRGASIGFAGVEKHYGQATVLSNFDLDIAAGEFMTLLGPSGSGKTTALNALAGFVDISRGDITVDGVSILGLPPEKRNIGMVFQSYALFPHMNVFENVAFPLRLRGIGGEDLRRSVDDSLQMVQLEGFAARMPNELSGGQRQRVAFARAMVFRPPILLMDEPLAALDLKLREAMRVEIKRYHKELGCTVLFVTHDQKEALSLSDRIAVMGNGAIAQVDDALGIYDNPRSRYVAEFIGQTNLLQVVRPDDGSLIFPEIGVSIEPEAWRGVFSNTVDLLSLRPEKLNLSPAASGAQIEFPVLVRDVMFLGENVHYVVLTPSGSSLITYAGRSAHSELFSSGDRLFCSFRLKHAVELLA